MKEKDMPLTAAALGRRIQSGEITVLQAVEESLARIEGENSQSNTFITIDAEGARAQAEIVQQGIKEGRYAGPLAGVPIAVKDNICTKGLRTTCGSRMLENYIPAYDAEVVTRLKAAGMIVMGKTNMDEFAMGSTSETSAFGPVCNPHHAAHTPGGSSGGSGAAVAAGQVFCALGSDTGGSVRQPASHCGIVGLKPTYGLVSRYGLVAYASSMDQIGPMTRTVEDCAALLDVICGWDPKDSTSVSPQGNQTGDSYLDCLQDGVAGLRIGIPKAYMDEELDPQVAKTVRKAANALMDQGAVVEEFDLALVQYAVPTYYTIASAEASSNLARYDGVKYGFRTKTYDGLHQMYKKTRAEGFGAEVKRRIMLGSFVLSAGYYDAYYLQALRTRRLIKEAFDQAFCQFDLILGPVAPAAAPRQGDSLQNPMGMYLADIYTIPANLTGIPAVSVPYGQDRQGLPIGVQLMADLWGERKLLAAAHALEQHRGDEAVGTVDKEKGGDRQ